MIVWEVNSKNFGAIAKKAALALQKGKIVACPTDTVYGLVADATDERAVRKVFLIKGRKKMKPLPIFVSSIAMAKKLAKVGSVQEKFLHKVWPGKVTLVLESRGLLAKETGTHASIGLRIPKHKLVQLLLQKVKTPLTGTSANLSGEPPLRESKEIFHQFQNRKHAPDVLIDAGKLLFSRPSMVIDITKEKPVVLRK